MSDDIHKVLAMDANGVSIATISERTNFTPQSVEDIIIRAEMQELGETRALEEYRDIWLEKRLVQLAQDKKSAAIIGKKMAKSTAWVYQKLSIYREKGIDIPYAKRALPPKIKARNEKIMSLSKAGVSGAEIGRAVGLTAKQVSRVARNLEADITTPQRVRPDAFARAIPRKGATFQYLKDAADKRATSVPVLSRKILDILANENLIDAILDDGVSHD